MATRIARPIIWRPEELPTSEHGRQRYLMLSTLILFNLFWELGFLSAWSNSNEQ